MSRTVSRLHIALYLPNILGYMRIVLAFVGLWMSTSQPVRAVWIWIFSAVLDLFDGPLARKLGQTSSLGVFLDIAADNLLRSCVWVAVVVASRAENLVVVMLSTLVLCLEWMTMVATQVYASSDGQHWKSAREKDPYVIQLFFSNNFRNPIGLLGIYGLFAANLFAYGSYHPVFQETIPYFSFWKYAAYVGRALSACIELYFCAGFFGYVIDKDLASRDKKR